MALHYVYKTQWLVPLAGVVLRTRVLMGIYTPAERWKTEYLEIEEEPSLTYTELKPPAAWNSGHISRSRGALHLYSLPISGLRLTFSIHRAPWQIEDGLNKEYHNPCTH